MLRYTLSLVLVGLLANFAQAGTGYDVSAKQDGKTVKYTVNFGGGRMFEQFTAFDPVSKAFVYLQWNRREQPPKPVGEIWDHQTGRTMKLYQFPGVKHPLPIIPSIEEMKVCPLTGDRNFKADVVIAYD